MLTGAALRPGPRLLFGESQMGRSLLGGFRFGSGWIVESGVKTVLRHRLCRRRLLHPAKQLLAEESIGERHEIGRTFTVGSRTPLPVLHKCSLCRYLKSFVLIHFEKCSF